MPKEKKGERSARECVRRVKTKYIYDPIGAPRPFDMQRETESNGSQSCFIAAGRVSAVAPSSAATFQILETDEGRRDGRNQYQLFVPLFSVAHSQTDLAPSQCRMMPSSCTRCPILTISSWGKMVPFKVFSSETMRVGQLWISSPRMRLGPMSRSRVRWWPLAGTMAVSERCNGHEELGRNATRGEGKRTHWKKKPENGKRDLRTHTCGRGLGSRG